jgi:hypothetical protein
MHKLFLFSAGALALAGCDFAGGSADATAPIASLQVSDLPAATETDGSAPDVFFEIQDVNGRSYYRSAVVNDADISAGASAAISGAVEIPSSTMPLQISVYDFDDSLNESTLMARSTRFTADEIAAAAELSLASADAASAARFTVTRGSIAAE